MGKKSNYILTYMTQHVYPTPSEQLLMEFIEANISEFANGFTDFKTIRDFTLQKLYFYLLENEDPCPMQHATEAVEVARSYARNNKVMKITFSKSRR